MNYFDIFLQIFVIYLFISMQRFNNLKIQIFLIILITFFIFYFYDKIKYKKINFFFSSF